MDCKIVGIVVCGQLDVLQHPHDLAEPSWLTGLPIPVKANKDLNLTTTLPLAAPASPAASCPP